MTPFGGRDVDLTAPPVSGNYRPVIPSHLELSMTTTPQPPAEPYTLGAVMPGPQPRKRRTGLVIGVVVAVLAVVGLGVGAVFLVEADDQPATPAAAASSSTCDNYGVDANTGAVVCKAPGAADVANQGPTYATPKPGDFKVAVQILEKKCFGSAGCNITYRIKPDYVGAAPLDPGVTWLVTYEVRGVEDGPQVNTFEVTGGQASFDGEEIAQTASSGAKLTAKATQVLRG